MRFLKIRGFTASTTYPIAGRALPPTHHVTLWQQPLWRWLLWRIYHSYDTVVWRMPGFRLLESALTRLGRGDPGRIPLGCRQDIRCFALERQGRVVLGTVTVDADLYTRITGRSPAR